MMAQERKRRLNIRMNRASYHLKRAAVADLVATLRQALNHHGYES
jgi:hypothetical protein